MSAAIQYIGSRISLISKSEIRYEGILYTIDAKESTVALQNVRSFGTEGRKKEGDQIPPSNEVYDYIIFRGADIKDLHVVETPQQPPVSPARPHDPAIISMQNPATLPHSNPNQGYPYPNYQYGPMTNPQFQMGPWGYGLPPNQYYAPFTPQSALGTGQQNPQANPQNQNRNQPSQPNAQEKKQQPQPSSQLPSTQEQKPQQQPQQQPQQPQVAHEPPKQPSKAPEPAQSQPQTTSAVDTQPDSQQTPQNIPQPVQNGENSTAQHHQRQQYSNRGRGGNQQRNYQGRYNQGDNRGGRGGGQRRPNSGNRNQGTTKTLDEFDLEASNARFEKEKILSEVAATQNDANSDKAYNKTSSFFDNISCEATDRMKQANEKRKTDTDMKKLDAETFGMERLNMRGRGGYRGGGRGGGQRRYGYNNNNNQNQNQNQNQRDNRQNNQSNGNSSYQKQVFRPVSGGAPGNGRDNRNRTENKQQ